MSDQFNFNNVKEVNVTSQMQEKELRHIVEIFDEMTTLARMAINRLDGSTQKNKAHADVEEANLIIKKFEESLNKCNGCTNTSTSLDCMACVEISHKKT